MNFNLTQIFLSVNLKKNSFKNKTKITLMSETTPSSDKLAIIAGSTCIELANQISIYLNDKKLTERTAQTFANGEPNVEILETVSGKVCFIIQTSLTGQMADNLLETLAISDALYRARAKTVCLVQLLFPGSRQERREYGKYGKAKRRPITARIVADMYTKVAGIKGIVTVHLHAGAIEGFFQGHECFVENLNPAQIVIDYLKEKKIINGNNNQVVLLAPDAGGVGYVSAIAKSLGLSYGIVDKTRTGPGKSEAMNIIGDVNGKLVLLWDDMVDSGNTAIKAAEKAISLGAIDVKLIATHPVLTGNAVQNLVISPFSEIIFTDTVPFSKLNLESLNKFTIIPVAPVLADIIANIFNNKPLEEIVKLKLEEENSVTAG